MQNEEPLIIQNNLLNQQEEIEELNLDYQNYQVVPAEYFAHLFEPSITFNFNKIYLNTACIKKLPSIEYVQLLVNPEERKLAVRPCNEEEKDSFKWCTAKRKPKHISCRVFFGKVMELMDWNCNYRYKLLGKLIKSNDEYLFIFDLKTPEIYVRTIEDGEKPKVSRRPIFPDEWQHQFGLPVTEHRKQMQVNIFKGYTVFGITNKKENTEHKDEQQEH